MTQVTDPHQDNRASDGTLKPVENYARTTKTELRTFESTVRTLCNAIAILDSPIARERQVDNVTEAIMEKATTLLEDTVREAREDERIRCFDNVGGEDIKVRAFVTKRKAQRLVELKEQGASSRQTKPSPNTKLNNEV